MNKKHALVLLSAFVIAGCEGKPEPITMPEVNNENCDHEKVSKMDESIRTEFASKCFRRGEFKESPKKGW